MKNLFKLWNEYRKDPDVLFNPDPPLGVVFTFEGFWLWLLRNNNEKQN